MPFTQFFHHFFFVSNPTFCISSDEEKKSFFLFDPKTQVQLPNAHTHTHTHTQKYVCEEGGTWLLMEKLTSRRKRKNFLLLPLIVIFFVFHLNFGAQTDMLASQDNASERHHRSPRAQHAFKISMVHGVLQFTLGIAVCCVLHRCESRDIRC